MGDTPIRYNSAHTSTKHEQNLRCTNSTHYSSNLTFKSIIENTMKEEASQYNIQSMKIQHKTWEKLEIQHKVNELHMY